MFHPRVTLAEVAAACGITRMTASRALREGTPVAPATRDRVRAAAARLGYRADPFLSGLAEHRHHRRRIARRSATIAYVTQYGRGSHSLNWRSWPMYLGYFEGAQRRAAELGYGLEEFAAPPVGSAGRATAVLAHRGYVGLLMAPTAAALGRTRLGMENFPAVALGNSLRKPRLHSAGPNHYQNVQDLLHELKRRGYQRPGLAVTRALDARSVHRWTASFRSWQELFLPPGNRVAICQPREDRFETDVSRWFEREKPDVVVSAIDRVHEVLVRAGVRFPEDAGAALLSLFPAQFGRLAGFSEDPDAIGTSAVDLLHMLILRNERGVPRQPLGLQVDGTWHDGPTLRAG